MNLKRRIPEYFVSSRNTVIQIAFTVVFAYAFILIYHPFGSQNWFDVNPGQFAFYSGFVVVLGMVVVIISRVIMTQIRKVLAIAIAGYIAMIAIEVLAMTGFYMMIQKVFLHDRRFWFEVYYTAIFNTTLILLIPYLISLLYFAWLDNKKLLVLLQRKKADTGKPDFVAFRDENDEVKLSLKLDDLLYIEANENYVFIHYVDAGVVKRFLLRNRLKRIESEFAGSPILRCHRSYLVNAIRIKLIKKTKTGFVLYLEAPEMVQVPVTETYRGQVLGAIRTINASTGFIPPSLNR